MGNWTNEYSQSIPDERPIPPCHTRPPACVASWRLVLPPEKDVPDRLREFLAWTVQSLMGHSHIRTTEAYLHSTDDRKVEAIQSLQFGV